mmetsp:Transcript_27203/g.59415  ORF Transcript_27203/g.59415 Transcript_27203/m.59415 type:complete len:238 (+) Transcript_27203:796-1509(+)
MKVRKDTSTLSGTRRLRSRSRVCSSSRGTWSSVISSIHSWMAEITTAFCSSVRPSRSLTTWLWRLAAAPVARPSACMAESVACLLLRAAALRPAAVLGPASAAPAPESTSMPWAGASGASPSPPSLSSSSLPPGAEPPASSPRPRRPRLRLRRSGSSLALSSACCSSSPASSSSSTLPTSFFITWSRMWVATSTSRASMVKRRRTLQLAVARRMMVSRVRAVTGRALSWWLLLRRWV